MSSVSTIYGHVVVREDGVPIIEGTTVKVVELVLETMAYGWSPEELHFQHPHISLGQIHSALAYYWDHKDDLDQDIAGRLDQADRTRERIGQSPLVDKLKAKGLI